MSVLQAPFFLLAISVIPLIPVYIWFQKKKYGIVRFLVPLAAGILTVPVAGFLQGFFPLHLPRQSEMGGILFGAFIRISLIEEFTRTLVLFLFFLVIPYSRISLDKFVSETFFGAPSGLCAGIGFAAAEGIFYGLVDPGVSVLRLFTAVPLHAACGARIGNSLGIAKKQPLAALTFFITAFFIHGTYDFCIMVPGIPGFLPVFIALAALVSSLFTIYYGDLKKA